MFDGLKTAWARCGHCKKAKHSSEFKLDKTQRSNISRYCKVCSNKYSVAYYKIPEHSKKILLHRRQVWRDLRAEMIVAYGSVCSCCGEDEPKFLTIDHVNGGGAKHKRSIPGRNVPLWLKKHEYPKKDFQLLCYNCNCGKAYNGGNCPHIISVKEAN